MKKSDSSKATIACILLVLVLTVAVLCLWSVTMINFCTTYTVISRCGNSIVILNERNLKDRQMRTVDPRSPLKNGDVVNGYLCLVRSYTTTGVEVLSDDYDTYN